MTAEERLERLEVELGRARRWNRWLLLLVGLAVGACLVVSGLVGREAQAQAAQQEVRAQRFVLVDDNGKVRAKLETSPDGPALWLYDEKGKPRVVLTALKEGSVLNLYDEKGEPRAGLGLTEGRPGLSLYDETGKTRAALDLTEDGPSLHLWDKDGKVLWQAP